MCIVDSSNFPLTDFVKNLKRLRTRKSDGDKILFFVMYHFYSTLLHKIL